GHDKIAIIAEDLSIASSYSRFEGFKQALTKYNKSYDDSLLMVSDISVEAGKTATSTLLKKKNPPTAIFACNDLLAIGVIQSVRENGLKVPDDLSVVGFDDTILATITDPPLTTVAQPVQEMG